MEPLRLLLVDDEPEMARLVSFMLFKEAPNFAIDIAEGGRECLEFLKKNEVDCIISDYQMPGMDGMELLLEIRGQGSGVPFIFLTGQGNQEVARDAFKNGADDYFTKEVGFAHFTRIINSVAQSVSRRKAVAMHMRAEEALQESEERLRAIFNSVNDAIIVHDLDTGAILDVNRRMCELYGYTSEEVCDIDVGALSSGEPPYTLDEAMKRMARAADGEQQLFEWHARDKAGRLFWVEVNMRRAVIGGKRRLLVTARDIGERKVMEDRLRESEARYRSFVANCSEAIWRFEMDEPLPVTLPEDEQVELLSRRLYLAECNDVAANVLGYESAEKALGARHDDIAPLTDPRNVEHMRRAIRAGYSLTRDEVFVRDTRGGIHRVYSSFSGVVEDGRLVRVWGVSNEWGVAVRQGRASSVGKSSGRLP